jgi:putative phage-type endonuclease
MNAPLPPQVDRRTFLGSSDMAAVLGLSPWKTPLEVYFEKIGEEPPPPDPEKEKLFRRGKRLEPVVVSMLIEERGLNIIARNKRYTDPEYPFMACEVDAEALDTGEHVNVECKTAHLFTSWKYGEEGTDEIPVEYGAQAMYALMITGRSRCIFGVLFGADNLVTYEVKRDEETIAAMRARAVRFWHDHVLARVPPPVVNLPDVLTMFKRLDKPIVIEATDEMFRQVAELDERKAAIRVASERVDELKFEIGKAMLGEAAIERARKPRGGLEAPKPTAFALPGKHMLVWSGEPVLTIAHQQQTRVDTDAVRTKHPEVAAECSKELDFFVFRAPTKAEKKFA